MKATEGISYYEARKKVKELHATPTPRTSYASAVSSRPVMCSVAIQTELTLARHVMYRSVLVIS